MFILQLALPGQVMAELASERVVADGQLRREDEVGDGDGFAVLSLQLLASRHDPGLALCSVSGAHDGGILEENAGGLL